MMWIETWISWFTEFRGVVPYHSAEDLAFSLVEFIEKGSFLLTITCIMEEKTLAGQLVDHLLPLAIIMMLIFMNMVCYDSPLPPLPGPVLQDFDSIFLSATNISFEEL